MVEQAHLDDLVAKNTESQLSSDELTELDRLLAEADSLMVLHRAPDIHSSV